MPFFKRIFGQGKSKAPNTLVALCIGDYSRITLAIEGKEAHQLQALLAHEVTPDEGSPSTSQVGHSVTKSSGPVSQTSFRALRHLLQHFGSGAGSTLPQDNAEVDAQRQFSHFIKNLGGYPSVSFLTAGEDGLITRDRVLAKLTKLFKHSNAPVVLVSYCGPSDERGNWRLATGQIPGASAGSISGTSGGGGGGGAPAGGGGGGVSGASGTCVLSFRELSTLWQRYRKHSQRLVLLLDCANSGYWVSALRMLSKAEQLELSLGVQASDCSLPDTQSMQLTYQPGIFVQFYLVNNKWRREQRRNVSGNSQHPQSAQHGPPSTTTTTNGAANSSTAAGNGRVEVWLPGMVPSYYATWLNDNLVDYGIALKFFNMQVNTTAAAAATACGGGEGQGSSISQPLLRKSEASVNPPFPTSPPGGIAALYHHYHHYHHHNHNRNVRASTGPIAAFDSSKLLGAASSRLGDDLTSPSSDPWASPRSGGTGAGSGTATGTGAAAAAAGSGTGKGTGVLGADQDIPEHGSLPERAVLRSAMALRAVSMQESARQRFSALFHDNCTADGAGSSPLAMPQGGLAGSPQTPTMHRVRLSTPQAEWYNSHIHSPPPFLGRSPTLPGEDSLYKMGHEMEGINNAFLRAGSHLASSSVMSPCGSGLVDLGHSGHTSGLAAAAATANGSSRLQCRSSGAVADTNTSGSQTFPSAPSRPAPELPLPYAPFHGPAVHHAVLDTTDDAGSSLLITTATAATATAAGDGCDEVLVVQPSAPSDSVAMAWDRRSSQAARHLADDRGGAAAASFTNPSMLERLPSGGGFANELFGALHEVATERRLRARRAPLGGDESLDTMMEDAELGSVASIPSFMLPRAQLPGGELSGSMGRVQPLPMDAATAANGPPSEPSAGGGGSSSISIPIRGSRGRGVSITSAAASITAAAQAQQRTSALLGLVTPGEPMRGGEQVSSVSQRKHTSRLFLTSVASAFSGEQTSAGQMGELGDVADGSGGGAAAAAAATSDEADCLREAEASHDGDEVDDEVSLSFGDARRRALMEVDQGRRQEQYGKLAAAGAPSAVAKGTQDMRTSILGTQESSGLPVAAAPPAAPTSMEWPQPVDSLPPSQAMPWLPSGHGLRRYHLVSGAGGGSGAGGLNSGCGNIPSSSGARGLIRQYVSIADSMDLDSASLCVPWQRRPGRFEMAGSESSSFVFGDDQERFDMLRLLREQEQQPGQQPVRHAQQQAGAAFQRTGQSALATATTAAAAAAALEAAVEGGSSSAVSDDVSSARREDEVEVDGREMQGFQLADVLVSMECAVVSTGGPHWQ